MDIRHVVSPGFQRRQFLTAQVTRIAPSAVNARYVLVHGFGPFEFLPAQFAPTPLFLVHVNAMGDEGFLARERLTAEGAQMSHAFVNGGQV